MIKYRPKPMTRGQMDALDTVIAYFEPDEYRHWEEEGKPEKNHTYICFRTLKDYRNQCFIRDKVSGKKDKGEVE